MSEEKKEQRQRPSLQFVPQLRPRRPDSRHSILESIISSDKNNPTKSRIPNPAGMAFFQLLGLWGSTKRFMSYQVQGEEKVFSRTIEGSHDLFKRLYDEDAISLDGKSRQEWTTAALGYFLSDIEDVQKAKDARMAEGQKKK